MSPNGNGTPDGFTDPIDLAKQAKSRNEKAAILGKILAIYTAVAATIALWIVISLSNQIRDCTTPSGGCYKTNTISARERTRALILDLQRQHDELKDEFGVVLCVLEKLPEVRTDTTAEECRTLEGK